MRYLLMHYDRVSRDRSLVEFVDRDEALAALRLEESRKKATVELVLFIAESEQDLRTSHSRYFDTPEDMTARLLAAAS